MKDILLKNGDLYLNKKGDLEFTNSISQAINIRLKWFYGEWMFAPDKGVKYYEDILVKNPDDNRIKMLISEQIVQVRGIKSVKSIDIKYDLQTRIIRVIYTAVSDQEILRGEVELWSSMV